ncbi:tripartite motif-containing protein 42-like [Aplochiton taeniatus]
MSGKAPCPKERVSKTQGDGLIRSLAPHLCCPACDTLLLQPVSLPCGHCLCQPCLTALRKKLSSTRVSEDQPCLRCRTLYSPFPGGTWAFPENTLLAHINEKLLEKVEGLKKVKQPKVPKAKDAAILRTAVCEICPKQRKAENYCHTCGVNYCAKCLKKLHDNRAFLAHSLGAPACASHRREPCPAHPERSLSYCCLDDGAVGCQGCMEQGHLGHDVSAIFDAQTRKEASLLSALEYAGKLKVVCEVDMKAMEELQATAATQGAELRRRVHQGFMLLRDTLLDKEHAMLAHLDALTSSTRTYITYSAPLVSSLAGLEVISEQALLEKDAAVFLSGAGALTRWLMSANGEIRRPAVNLQEGEPFRDVEMDFDGLHKDLERALECRLLWKTSDGAFAPLTPVESYSSPRPMGEAQGAPAPSSPIRAIPQVATSNHGPPVRVETVPLGSCPSTPTRGVIRASSCAGSPVHHRFTLDAPLSPVKTRGEQLPAGDSGAAVASAGVLPLLPRPPTIYLHAFKDDTVEMQWMVPMEEDVESVDMHFQEVGGSKVEEWGVVVSELKGSSMQTTVLRPSTLYHVRARSVNRHGAGQWSSPYRLNTNRQGGEVFKTRTGVSQEV